LKSIKEIREENKLLQKDIAKLLGISTTGYAGKESGYRKFKTHEALIICNFFGIDINDVSDFLPPSTRKEDDNRFGQAAS